MEESRKIETQNSIDTLHVKKRSIIVLILRIVNLLFIYFSLFTVKITEFKDRTIDFLRHSDIVGKKLSYTLDTSIDYAEWIIPIIIGAATFFLVWKIRSEVKRNFEKYSRRLQVLVTVAFFLPFFEIIFIVVFGALLLYAISHMSLEGLPWS